MEQKNQIWIFAAFLHSLIISLQAIKMRPFVRKSSKRAAMAVGLVVGTAYVLEALKIKKKVDQRELARTKPPSFLRGCLCSFRILRIFGLTSLCFFLSLCCHRRSASQLSLKTSPSTGKAPEFNASPPNSPHHPPAAQKAFVSRLNTLPNSKRQPQSQGCQEHKRTSKTRGAPQRTQTGKNMQLHTRHDKAFIYFHNQLPRYPTKNHGTRAAHQITQPTIFIHRFRSTSHARRKLGFSFAEDGAIGTREGPPSAVIKPVSQFALWFNTL